MKKTRDCGDKIIRAVGKNRGREKPLFSIVTPSFNQARYLEETIRSVLAQPRSLFEYFVFDGGSTDGSVDILEKYSSEIDYWVAEPDRGQSHAINKGLARARGLFFYYLNSDDLLLPGALERVAKAVSEYPETDVFYGKVHHIDEEGGVLKYIPHRVEVFELERVAWGSPFVAQQGVFVRTEFLRRAGGFREDLHCVMDTECWIRLGLRGARWRFLDEFLGAFRIYGAAKSYRWIPRMTAERGRVLEEHGKNPEAPWKPQHRRISAGLYFAAALGYLRNNEPEEAARWGKESLRLGFSRARFLHETALAAALADCSDKSKLGLEFVRTLGETADYRENLFSTITRYCDAEKKLEEGVRRCQRKRRGRSGREGLLEDIKNFYRLCWDVQKCLAPALALPLNSFWNVISGELLERKRNALYGGAARETEESVCKASDSEGDRATCGLKEEGGLAVVLGGGPSRFLFERWRTETGGADLTISAIAADGCGAAKEVDYVVLASAPAPLPASLRLPALLDPARPPRLDDLPRLGRACPGVWDGIPVASWGLNLSFAAACAAASGIDSILFFGVDRLLLDASSLSLILCRRRLRQLRDALGVKMFFAFPRRRGPLPVEEWMNVVEPEECPRPTGRKFGIGEKFWNRRPAEGGAFERWFEEYRSKAQVGEDGVERFRLFRKNVEGKIEGWAGSFVGNGVGKGSGGKKETEASSSRPAGSRW
ncbi:MAG: glycosyltransferase [Candidatus Hydrogenedentota bacterium]|nr:MAG: glycosyltransferase [Candidatus Hydrogenedentota bacterium]